MSEQPWPPPPENRSPDTNPQGYAQQLPPQQPYMPYPGYPGGYQAPPPKRPWYKKKRFIIPIAFVVLLIIISAFVPRDGAVVGATGETAKGTGTPAAGKTTTGLPKGVYAFGATVKFGDGSTLTASKPVSFNPSTTAFGGEKSPEHIYIKLTFTNNTDEVYDPTLTTDNVSSADEEGDSVYDEGFDSPDNKLLPGHKVSWKIAYGVLDAKHVTLTESMGFLDYDDVIFTNETNV